MNYTPAPDAPFSYFSWKQAVKEALQSGAINATTYVVVDLLAGYADYSTGEHARPSVETLVSLSRLSASTVKRSLSSAVGAGLITPGKHGGGTGPSARGTEYHLTTGLTGDPSSRTEVTDGTEVTGGTSSRTGTTTEVTGDLQPSRPISSSSSSSSSNSSKGVKKRPPRRLRKSVDDSLADENGKLRSKRDRGIKPVSSASSPLRQAAVLASVRTTPSVTKSFHPRSIEGSSSSPREFLKIPSVDPTEFSYLDSIED